MAGGSVAAETLATIKAERKQTPPGRFTAIAEDAARLLAAQRLAKDTRATIQMPRLGHGPERPGSTAADIVFVDAAPSRTIARISPTSPQMPGPRDRDIATRMAWVSEDPERRDVEIDVLSEPETGLSFAPPTSLAGP